MHPNPDAFRILMVLDEAYPPDIRVENEASSLLRAGFEVALLSIAPDTRPIREICRGVRVYRRRIPKQVRNKLRGLAGTIPLLTLYLDQQIRRVYGEYQFHALHMHDLHLLGGGLRAARRLGVPVIGDLHENYVEVLTHYAWSTRFPGKLFVSIPRWRRLEKLWVNATDRLILVVEERIAHLKGLGVPESRLVIVPNTIQTQVFDDFEVDTDIVNSVRSNFTIVYTGTINLHRGLDTLIRAMPRVVEECGGFLVIVGDGSIRTELEMLAVTLGVAPHVRFLGWKPQALIKSYILGSDVCVAPHVKGIHNDAAIPHKLFHYMYFKKPVVVTNCRPMERIVNAHQCGIVCPSGDAAAITQALLALAADPEGQLQMGRNGRQAVLDKYNWDATIKGMVEMYKELSRSRRQAG